MFVFEQLLYMAFHYDPAGSSHLQAAIPTQLIPTPNSSFFFFFSFKEMTGEVYTAKLKKA